MPGICTPIAAGREAVVHAEGAARVIAFAAVQGADDRQVVHLLGGHRQDFGDLDARGAGLDRLELALVLRADADVPGVHVGRAAAHPQDDDVLALGLQGRSSGVQVVGEGHARRGSGHRARRVLQEVTPIHHVFTLAFHVFPIRFSVGTPGKLRP